MAFIRFVLYPPYTHTHTYVNRQPPPLLPLTHTLPLASFSHYIMWAWTKIKRWITAEKTGRYSLSRLLWNGWISGQCEIKQKPVLSFETKTKKTQNKPCRDVRFLSTFMVVSFSFFFFLKMDFPTLHHRPDTRLLSRLRRLTWSQTLTSFHHSEWLRRGSLTPTGIHSISL